MLEEKILFSTPIQNEKYYQNVVKLLKSKKSLHGPGINIEKIKDDLKKNFGFKNVLLTHSCTAAMEICALTLNLNKNDEVLMPSYNYNTTASSFVKTGCKIRFCDIDTKNLMPSFNQITQNINSNTKVIIIIHMQGLSIDYLDKLAALCKKKRIILIEDAAPALGSYFKNKPLGRFGDFATFSFHETKNYQCGMGGLLVINNKKYLRKSNIIFDKGTDRSYVVSDPKYHKKYYSWLELGSCFRMPEINASYLQPQINDIKSIISFRSKIYFRYLKNFKPWLNGEFLISNKNFDKYKYNFHAFTIILKKNDRENFLSYLSKNKITAFISFEALHLSRIGKEYVDNKTNLTITNNIVKKIVRLPMHNKLKLKDVDYISDKIREYYQ